MRTNDEDDEDKENLIIRSSQNNVMDDRVKTRKEGGEQPEDLEEPALCSEHLENHLLFPGKVFYRAPDMYTGAYDPRKADVFACGVMLYTLRFGGFAFEAPYPSFLFPEGSASGWGEMERCSLLREQLALAYPQDALSMSPPLLDLMELLLCP